MKKCPNCGWRTLVVDCRERKYSYYRRYKCMECGTMYNTQEIPEEEYHSLLRDREKYEEMKELLRSIL